jgi:hypothetical protein
MTICKGLLSMPACHPEPSCHLSPYDLTEPQLVPALLQSMPSLYTLVHNATLPLVDLHSTSMMLKLPSNICSMMAHQIDFKKSLPLSLGLAWLHTIVVGPDLTARDP